MSRQFVEKTRKPAPQTGAAGDVGAEFGGGYIPVAHHIHKQVICVGNLAVCPPEHAELIVGFHGYLMIEPSL